MKFLSHWCRNEKEVESKFIALFFLPILGYSHRDWYQEVRYKNIRLDFLLIPMELAKMPYKIKRNTYVIIEAKHPQEKLDIHIPKFRRYLNTFKIKYGVITNAQDIRLYKRQKENIYLLLQYQVKEIDRHIIAKFRDCRIREYWDEKQQVLVDRDVNASINLKRVGLDEFPTIKRRQGMPVVISSTTDQISKQVLSILRGLEKPASYP